MRKIKNPWCHAEGFDCFGCSPDNPLGVHMEFYEDGEEVVSCWQPSKHYQGWVNTLHGGILSTLIDEISAWVVFRRLQTTGVTSRLEVRFRRPIMTTEPRIILRAKLLETQRQIAVLEVKVYDSKNQLCTEGRVSYYTFPADKAAEMGFEHCELIGEEVDIQ